MAFDLVQYFAEQIQIQKPQLLKQCPADQRKKYICEINTLALAKLITLWRYDANKVYQEIRTQDQLYIQEIARHLTTCPKNQSNLSKSKLEDAITQVLSVQFSEIKQLDDTGNFGPSGLKELLLGQIEHLSGQAYDWVWATTELTELIGSKPIEQEELSLEETMKEFNQMVNQQNIQESPHQQPVQALQSTAESTLLVPRWARVLEPVVALVILWILFSAYHNLMGQLI